MANLFLQFRLAFVRPFRFAVFEKLLERIETDLAVVQCVVEIAIFVNPSRGNPRERQPGELFDFVIAFAWTRVSKDRDVGLIANVELFKHCVPILPIVPNGYEPKFHFRIFVDDFGPAAALEFSLAVRAPRRPKMDDGEIWRFDRV